MESKSENNGLQDWIINRYLVSIGRLEERESPVSTSSIAQQLGLSLASVTEMLIRLAQKGLVEYTRYRGAQLTAKGKQSYIRLIRCRRLWEVFLIGILKSRRTYSSVCSTLSMPPRTWLPKG